MDSICLLFNLGGEIVPRSHFFLNCIYVLCLCVVFFFFGSLSGMIYFFFVVNCQEWLELTVEAVQIIKKKSIITWSIEEDMNSQNSSNVWRRKDFSKEPMHRTSKSKPKRLISRTFLGGEPLKLIERGDAKIYKESNRDSLIERQVGPVRKMKREQVNPRKWRYYKMKREGWGLQKSK